MEVAGLVVQKPDRYEITLPRCVRQRRSWQPLFVCSLDDPIWLSEAMPGATLLKAHFDTFLSDQQAALRSSQGALTLVAVLT